MSALLIIGGIVAYLVVGFIACVGSEYLATGESTVRGDEIIAFGLCLLFWPITLPIVLWDVLLKPFWVRLDFDNRVWFSFKRRTK